MCVGFLFPFLFVGFLFDFVVVGFLLLLIWSLITVETI